MINKKITAAIRAERDYHKRFEVARQRVTSIIGMDAALQATTATQLYQDALQTLGFDAKGVSLQGLEAMMDMAGQIPTPPHSQHHSLSQNTTSDSPLFGASPNRKA